MRVARCWVAAGFGYVLFGSGCYAALPPPGPPHVTGFVEAKGGALGDWRLAAVKVAPVDGMIAVDVTDPATPGPVLRITSVDPPPAPAAGIVEHVMRRTTELRIANVAAAKGKQEALLSQDNCKTLDVILRARGDGAGGSARFDCALGDLGHVTGDVEFAALGYGGPSHSSGSIQASAGTVAGEATAFVPNRCDGDKTGVVFWDILHPRLQLQVEQGPKDSSITGGSSNATLLVTSTAPGGKSFELSPDRCRTLTLSHDSTGFIRVGNDQTSFYSGSVDIDCTTPEGGRLAGSLKFDGC
jgi:hypothetical protein